MKWLWWIFDTTPFERAGPSLGISPLLQWSIRAPEGLICFAFLIMSSFMLWISFQRPVKPEWRLLLRWFAAFICIGAVRSFLTTIIFIWPAYRFLSFLLWLKAMAAVG